jgi:hypothetical protein
METDHTLVLVTWLDITAVAGWEPAKDVEPTEVQTIGWIAYEDDKVLKIGNSLGEDGDVYGITALPQGCVLSTTVLHVSPVPSPGLVAAQQAPSSQPQTPTPIVQAVT